MIEEINANNLVNSELFVKEPVNEFYKKINNTESSKIILTGGRGTGKSVILMNKEKNDISREDKSIYMHFDPCSRFGSENCRYDERFVIHYYELLFSNKLLHHIKDNYILTYNKYFKEKHVEVKNKIMEMDAYINNIFSDDAFKNHLALGDFSYDIIEKLKEVLEVNKLTLMLDRFDSIDGSSEISQKILSNYFRMFDKTILSTNDIALMKDNRSNITLDDTYQFIDVDYGTNPDVVKEILSKRIIKHNENVDLAREGIFPLEIITDEMYEYLANNCNGDIKVMIDRARDLIREFWFYGEERFSLGLLERYCQAKKSYYDDIYRSLNKPSLYLVKK